MNEVVRTQLDVIKQAKREIQEYFDNRMKEFARHFKVKIDCGMGTYTADMFVPLKDGTIQHVPLHNLLADLKIGTKLGEQNRYYSMTEADVRERLDYRINNELPEGKSNIDEQQIQRVIDAQRMLMGLTNDACELAGELDHAFEYIIEIGPVIDCSTVDPENFKPW